jgi:NADPH:quinone reductase-like Zn-dependent oxidoreductase
MKAWQMTEIGVLREALRLVNLDEPEPGSSEILVDPGKSRWK